MGIALLASVELVLRINLSLLEDFCLKVKQTTKNVLGS
jgi:hypothetical protein